MLVQSIAGLAAVGAWSCGVYFTWRAHAHTLTPRRGMFVRVGWRDLTPKGRQLALRGLAGYGLFVLIVLAIGYFAR